MRRSLVRSGFVPAAVALVLVTGCGSSDDGDTTASEETSASATETSAPETTAPETSPAEDTGSEDAGSRFCREATSIQERLTGSAGAAGDPRGLPQIFREAAEEIRSIEAPAELAPDWNALADGAERFASTLQDVDLTDPNALATLEQRLAPLEQELNEASTNVQNYLVDECGIQPPTGETAPST
ncbi:hypothetical protein [Blastococcus sp. SYSU DS0539]